MYNRLVLMGFMAYDLLIPNDNKLVGVALFEPFKICINNKYLNIPQLKILFTSFYIIPLLECFIKSRIF